MTTISFARHQFPPDIIRRAVWLYLRFTLSFRDVEDLLAERGLDVSYETVRRWVLKFGPLFARELRRRRHGPTAQWHLDEMAVLIGGRRFWLWRAVDDEGEVFDILVQRRRDASAAARLREAHAQIAQEAGVCAQDARHRQAALLWGGQGATRLIGWP
jgi:putative transposase